MNEKKSAYKDRSGYFKTHKTESCGVKDGRLKFSESFLQILCGLLAGFINGLFGGGGGMIVVPGLRFLLGYRTNAAHATAIAVILPLSVLSGVFYTVFGNFEFQPVVFTTVGVTVGGIVGAFLLKKLSSKPLTVIFSAVMAIAGVKMLFF